MSRRRYFEEQRSGNGAIYHCVKTEIEPGDKIRLFNLMNKVKSDTISQDKINSVLNQLREGTAFNIHTGGKGQGYTTRDFGEPTGKRNAGGGGADRNRDGGMGGESDYDEGCGIGRGNRKSGGYGGGGCGSEGTGGDGTVLIRGKRYKS